MGRDDDIGPGLNRETVVEAALDLLDETGVDGLSMRGVADRLGVKAASLYWHLRDKEQLLELVAAAVLDRVEVPATPTGWRDQLASTSEQLASVVRRHRAADAVVRGCLPAVERSRLVRDITRVIGTTGLDDPLGPAFALVIEVVAAASLAAAARPVPTGSGALTLDIDSGSWKIQVRAAPPGSTSVATSVGGGGAPSVDIRPDGHVVVRNRGAGKGGAVELSRDHTWNIKVHGGTWNTTLDLGGLRLGSVELDSGAVNVTCTLPAPVGIVPVRANSGIVGVTLRRPVGSAAQAVVAPGSAKVRLDGQMMRPVGGEVHWESPGAAGMPDRYEITVCSGCVKVTVDASAPAVAIPPRSVSTDGGGSGPGERVEHVVGLILDGIEHRLSR